MSPVVTSTQPNVRMSKSLKEAGDSRLAQAGYSPSELVRMVWNGAGRPLAGPPVSVPPVFYI